MKKVKSGNNCPSMRQHFPGVANLYDWSFDLPDTCKVKKHTLMSKSGKIRCGTSFSDISPCFTLNYFDENGEFPTCLAHLGKINLNGPHR